MENLESANVIAFPRFGAAADAVRKLQARERATVPPPAVPWIAMRTTDPSQTVTRVGDNAYRIEGLTADSMILQTLLELTVEMKTVRVALGRAEGPHATAARVMAAVPMGYRAEVTPSLPLGSVVVTVERDDESRKETAAA